MTHEHNDHLIRTRHSRRRPRGWLVSVCEARREPPYVRGFRVNPLAGQLTPVGAWRSVIGVYASKAAAVQAGRDALAMQEEKRLCSPRDIDRVRKELAERAKRFPLLKG